MGTTGTTEGFFVENVKKDIAAEQYGSFGMGLNHTDLKDEYLDVHSIEKMLLG